MNYSWIYQNYLKNRDWFIDNSVLRDIFLKNLKYPALFGKVTLSNFKLIDTELNKINNKISKKLEEFDSYLKTYQKK